MECAAQTTLCEGRSNYYWRKKSKPEVFSNLPAMQDTTLAIPTTRPVLGEHFGPYQIVSQLGAGGMSEVFRA
jgi:hypothetical protein